MLSLFLSFAAGAVAVAVAAIFFYQVGYEAGYQKAGEDSMLTDEDNENLFRDITRKGDFDGRY